MIPRKLKNFVAFVDGYSYAGLVEELEPPKLSIKTEEYRGGGMDAPVEVDMGMEKLEASCTFGEYSAELFKQLGLVHGSDVSIVFRGALGDGSDTKEMIIELRGGFKELDSGSWKGGDNSTLKASIAAVYYKLTIDGSDVVEIDIENMIRIIGGTDQLAEQRAALGL